VAEDSAAGKDNELETKQKPDLKDKIVSPVMPQPGAWKRPPQYGHRGSGSMAWGDVPVSDGRFSRFRPGSDWQHKEQKL
jgi:hypothetical protein